MLTTCTYLWSLTRGVICVAPKHHFADLVQNAVCFFKIPLGLFLLPMLQHATLSSQSWPLEQAACLATNAVRGTHNVTGVFQWKRHFFPAAVSGLFGVLFRSDFFDSAV